MLKSKTLMIGEIEYKIKQFTPWEGIAVVRELLTQSFPPEFLESLGLPDILGKFVGKPKDIDIKTSIKNLAEIQKVLLSEVYFKSGNEFTKIIDDAGNSRLPEGADDYFTIFKLYSEVMKVNYGDFFTKCQEVLLDFMKEHNLIEKIDKEERPMPKTEEAGSTIQEAAQEFATRFLQSEKN